MAESDVVAESLARINKKNASKLQINADMIHSMNATRRKKDVPTVIIEDKDGTKLEVSSGLTKSAPLLTIEESMQTDAILEVIAVSESLLDSDDPEMVKLGVKLGKAIIRR